MSAQSFFAIRNSAEVSSSIGFVSFFLENMMASGDFNRHCGRGDVDNKGGGGGRRRPYRHEASDQRGDLDVAERKDKAGQRAQPKYRPVPLRAQNKQKK